MKLLSTPDQDTREPQLRRNDWIVCALEMLVDEGVESVQITRLARVLGVTRGSFYWHFKAREDLLSALLDEWSARNTGVMVDVLRDARTLEDGILDLFLVWVDHSKFDPRLDHAVRDWARRDDVVKDIVSKEDDDRVETIAQFFARHSFDQPEAFIRARVIYFTQLTYYGLNVREPLDQRLSYLPAYIRCFTGRELTQAMAVEFETRVRAQEANI